MNCLSRFQSIFALESVDEFQSWPELTDGPYRIFEIEVSYLPQHFDSMWLRGGMTFCSTENNWHFGFSPAKNAEIAFHYWSGDLSDTPRIEYLLSAPVRIGRIVHSST